MKRILFVLVITVLSVSVLSTTAFAQKPVGVGKPNPPSDDGASELVGYDVSYPQCGKRLPDVFYFAILGVNGGNAASGNPCLIDQLNWAKAVRSGSNQEPLQLYVNTANPAEETIYSWASWPTSSPNGTPYGDCVGEKTNDMACSWQYGWNRSVETAAYFSDQAQKAGINNEPASYKWWLDVETMNSWQNSSTEALDRNVAALEGFAAYYQSLGTEVGIYSTAIQWGEITGNQISGISNLNGLDNWRPSGASLSNAINNCGVDSLTSGGKISLTQYVKKNLDHNHSCN